MKTIMIADDDRAILDAVCIMLEFEGYNVACTPDGADVLKLRSDLPDLLLLDIWMSGMDGRDICRQLKQDAATHHLPVVLISASRDIEMSALAAGADDFLAKPFEIDDLLGKIERNLAG